MVWHYTTRARWRDIQKSGAIRPADLHVPPHEKPVVWFSSASHWEPTCAKAISTLPDRSDVRRLSMGEMHEQMGLVRFGPAPEVELYDWTAFTKLSGITPREAAALAAKASS